MAQKHAAENLPLKTPGKNPPKKNPPPGPAFHIREAVVCGQLQMSKDEVRHRREHFLTQGKHWELIDKRVQYSAIGLEVLLGTRTAVLPPDRPGRGNDDKRPAAGDSAPARKPVALLLEKNPTRSRLEFKGKLIVWAAPPRNTKVVVCYLPGSDPYNPLNLVALRVRDNSNFLRGMEVPPEARPGKPLPPGPQVKVTPVKDRDDVFDLSGPTPRQRGRW